MGREVRGWRGGLCWPAVIVGSILAAGLAGSAFAQSQGKEAATTIPASHITVLVLNGTHRIDLANRVSRELASRGFSTRRLQDRWVANAPRLTQRTTIFVDRRQNGASAAALRLRRLVGGGRRAEGDATRDPPLRRTSVGTDDRARAGFVLPRDPLKRRREPRPRDATAAWASVAPMSRLGLFSGCSRRCVRVVV